MFNYKFLFAKERNYFLIYYRFILNKEFKYLSITMVISKRAVTEIQNKLKLPNRLLCSHR